MIDPTNETDPVGAEDDSTASGRETGGGVSRRRLLGTLGTSAAAGLAFGSVGAGVASADQLDRDDQEYTPNTCDGFGTTQSPETLVERMTVDEKIDTVVGEPGPAPDPSLFYNRCNPRLGIPEFQMGDGPYGAAIDTAEGPATAFPVCLNQAASWDEGLMREVGRAAAR